MSICTNSVQNIKHEDRGDKATQRVRAPAMQRSSLVPQL